MNAARMPAAHAADDVANVSEASPSLIVKVQDPSRTFDTRTVCRPTLNAFAMSDGMYRRYA